MSPEAVLLMELAQKGISLVRGLVAGAPSDELRVQHERQVSDAIKQWQMATGSRELTIPVPFNDPSEPPQEE